MSIINDEYTEHKLLPKCGRPMRVVYKAVFGNNTNLSQKYSQNLLISFSFQSENSNNSNDICFIGICAWVILNSLTILSLAASQYVIKSIHVNIENDQKNYICAHVTTSSYFIGRTKAN